MISKQRENQLMWERYMGNPMDDSGEDDMDIYQDPIDPDMEDFIGEEDPMDTEVLSIEPMGEIETGETCNEVVYSDIKKLAEYSNRILEICKETELEDWMQAKLVKASDYVSDIWHRLDAEADFANTGVDQSDEF